MIRRMIAVDIKEGMREMRWWLAAAVLLFAVQSASLFLSASAQGLPATFSLGEHLFSYLEGMLPFTGGADNTFHLPIAWTVLTLYGTYLTLWYPANSLAGFGRQLLVAAKSRWAWWLSKCLWVLLACLAYCGVGFAVACVATGVTGGSFEITAPDNLVKLYGWDQQVRYNPGAAAAFLLFVPLSLASICTVQLVASIFVSPALAFALTISQLFFAAFFHLVPILPGNYLMAARNLALFPDGYDPVLGIVLSLAIIDICVLVGGSAFSRLDILTKEH